MTTVTSEGIAVESSSVHRENRSQSLGQERESSNLLRPAFQKAIERAADRQAAADQAALNEIGKNEAARHPLLECEAVTTPADDLMVQILDSSACARQNGETQRGVAPDASGDEKSITLSALRTDNVASVTPVPGSPQTPLVDAASPDTQLEHSVETVQASADASASRRLNSAGDNSMETQGVASTSAENQTVATSEHVAVSQPFSSVPSAAPIARGGIDQQAFDALSHMLSRQTTLVDRQTDALTLKVIAGMPGVESLKVQQDQSGQWHLMLQLNTYNRQPEEHYKEELLDELSRRGHMMGSVSIFQSTDAAFAERDL